MFEHDEWISARDASKMLGGVTTRTIANWSKSGAFSSRKFGPRVTRYRRDEVFAYRESFAVY